MFADNPLLAQLKQKMQESLPKVEGTVKATDKSYGFLEVDNKTSYFIAPAFMKKCMHGDKLSAIVRSENGKESAEPDELLESGLSRFVARIKLFKGRLQIVPDHPQMKTVTLKAKARKGVNPETLIDGDWVVAELIQHPLKNDQENTNTNGQFLAEITERIAAGDDKIAPWWVTLAKNDLPNCEPKGLDTENGESWNLQDDPALIRQDLTHIPFITIDGESTKDMDDALYAEKNADGTIKLMIAIADPTAYIQPNSDMDTVARERGFTIYLPGRNIPMLPRELADNLCSLRQDEQRPALCCTVTVGTDGTLADDIEFFAATIQSHAQLSYNQVSDWLEKVSTTDWQPSPEIKAVLTCLHEMSQLRASWRQLNAVVFPDRPDYHFELSEDNDVVAIHTEYRRPAHKLVEEAMVSANICAGTKLKQVLNTGIFNAHAGFKPENIADVLALINPENEHPFTAESIVTLDGFGDLRRWLSAKEDPYLDHRIRRMQSYSEISATPAPHYAMGIESYATWTSPIRKYSDMVNHRLLKAIVLGSDVSSIESLAAANLVPDEALGGELMIHRRHHNMAERNIAEWLYCRTLVGDVEKETRFNAEIFDINRAGMRVRLIENGAAAFIPCRFIVDNKERISASRELGTVEIDKNVEFKLGDMVEVVLTIVNLDTRSLLAKPVAQFAQAESEQAETTTN